MNLYVKIKHLSFLSLVAICLLSCQSKEEKLLKRMDKLTMDVETCGRNYSIADWIGAVRELQSIHDDMEDCHFTDEQLHEVAVKDGQLSVIFAREGAKGLNDKMHSIVKDGVNFVQGLKEGVSSEYDEDEFGQIGNDMQTLFEDLSKEIVK